MAIIAEGNVLNILMVTLLLGGFAVYFSNELIQRRNQKKYEEELVARYREIINRREYNPFGMFYQQLTS